MRIIKNPIFNLILAIEFCQQCVEPNRGSDRHTRFVTNHCDITVFISPPSGRQGGHNTRAFNVDVDKSNDARRAAERGATYYLADSQPIISPRSLTFWMAGDRSRTIAWLD
jgi:hypothetical protein